MGLYCIRRNTPHQVSVKVNLLRICYLVVAIISPGQKILEDWWLVCGFTTIFCYHDNILHNDINPLLARNGTTFLDQSLQDSRSWMYVHGIVMVILRSGGAFGAVLACFPCMME